MLKRIAYILVLLLSICCMFGACSIGDKEPKFVVGEEILFENGEEFYLPGYNWRDGEVEDCRITAKMVAVEEYTLDNPSRWPYKDQYLFSYKYRIYVTGYCSAEREGEEMRYTLSFRTDPFNGVSYTPQGDYEAGLIGVGGRFSFSVDVYMPDLVTKVIPIRLYELSGL